MKPAKTGPHTPLSSLHRLEFILQHKSDTVLRGELGVGFGQVQILQALNRAVPTSQRLLAFKLHQTESNVSRQVALLRKRGLVAISRNKKDKRQREVSLTPKGNRVYASAEKLLSAQHKELLKLVDRKEILQFEGVVNSLLRALG